MTDRYTASNMDTHGEVWDRHQQRIVSRHALILDAEAEAARLNAAAGKRAAPVTAWAAVIDGVLMPLSLHTTRALVASPFPLGVGDRIARVEIREISDDE